MDALKVQFVISIQGSTMIVMPEEVKQIIMLLMRLHDWEPPEVQLHFQNTAEEVHSVLVTWPNRFVRCIYLSEGGWRGWQSPGGEFFQHDLCKPGISQQDLYVNLIRKGIH